jgi:hypothetical protein
MSVPERVLLKHVQVAVSEDIQDDVDTPYSLAADFESIYCDQVLPAEPALNLVEDSDQVGDGREGPKNPRPYNWNAGQLSLGMKLNTRMGARLAKRFQGGGETPTLVATGVYDHVINMQSRQQGTTPELSTVAMLLGGSDPINSSMAVNSMTISQQGIEEPKVAFDLMGNGHHRYFRDVYRVQVITVTGTPAGGTVVIDFDGQPATINFDDTAAEVLVTLQALSNIAAAGADIAVTGGPLPGTPIVVTFKGSGAWGSVDVPLMTVTTNSLTGGTAPAMTITPQAAYLVLPDPPSYDGLYMHGSKLQMELNNGSVIDLDQFGVVSSQITFNQNIEWTALPGVDRFLIDGETNSGSYPRCVSRGERMVVPELTAYLDREFKERYWPQRNLSITGLKFTWQGSRIGSTAYYNEFEVTCPLSKLRPVTLEQVGNWAGKKMSFLTQWVDPYGFASIRIRNGMATLT